VLERVFHLEENQTTVRRELLAGLTTFMTMAYVVVVNPRILSEAGMPVEGFSSPLAFPPRLLRSSWGSGPTIPSPRARHVPQRYFTYSIVLGRGVPWQTASVSSSFRLALSHPDAHQYPRANRQRHPDCLKYGTAAGIGLFIAFIGLRNANIIVANPATFVGLGKTSDPKCSSPLRDSS